jgi:rubrerythrin
MKGMKWGVIIELAGSTALEAAKNIFQTMRIEESILADLKTKLDAYRYVIEIEADSIELYEDMLKNTDMNWSPAAVALLLKIIEEEKKHYNIMENLHDLIAEYDHLLVWREFDKVRSRGIL